MFSYSPKWRHRNPIGKFVHSPENIQARDSSNDSYLEPTPLTLKAIFQRFWKKGRNVKRGNISQQEDQGEDQEERKTLGHK